MALITYLKNLKPGQFYDQIVAKTGIILHHTAGSSALAAVDWWNQTPERVGTAILVERDGQGYQCFETNRWAYHLGVPINDKRLDIHTVGIEIVSYGWVRQEEDKNFYAYPMWPLKQGKVKIATDQVIELDKPWRGEKFYHKYTDQQVETIVKICRYLVDKYSIKVQENLDNFWEYDFSVATQNKPGIWSHTTVRKDKSDIFPQPNLIAALKKEFTKKKP